MESPLLIGIAKSLPGILTFVTPVFTNLKQRYCIQRIHQSLVSGYAPLSVGPEYEPLQTDLRIEIGTPAIYAFQLSDCIYAVGTGPTLVHVLVKFVKGSLDGSNMHFTRATTSAIIRFASEIPVKEPGTSSEHVVGSFFRRQSRIVGTRFDPTSSLPIASVPESVLGNMDLLDDYFDRMGAVEQVKPRGLASRRPATCALIVDDSATVRRATQRLLQNVGINTLTAQDGIAAFEVLKNYSPDVILIDIEMPRMDGYEFARQLKMNDRLSGIPLVFVTSVSKEASYRQTSELGITQYIRKPFHETQLLKAIESLVPSDGWY